MNYYCVHSKGNFINQPNMRLLFLLLFCSVLCAHAQVSNRSDEMPDSSFISTDWKENRRTACFCIKTRCEWKSRE